MIRRKDDHGFIEFAGILQCSNDFSNDIIQEFELPCIASLIPGATIVLPFVAEVATIRIKYVRPMRNGEVKNNECAGGTVLKLPEHFFQRLTYAFETTPAVNHSYKLLVSLLRDRVIEITKIVDQQIQNFFIKF